MQEQEIEDKRVGGTPGPPPPPGGAAQQQAAGKEDAYHVHEQYTRTVYRPSVGAGEDRRVGGTPGTTRSAAQQQAAGKEDAHYVHDGLGGRDLPLTQGLGGGAVRSMWLQAARRVFRLLSSVAPASPRTHPKEA